MATGISWADETWNPVVGCTPVSPGCAHCYAAAMARRLERWGRPQYQGLTRPDGDGWSSVVRCLPEALGVPYRWTRPRVVFVGSMCDLFHDSVPTSFLDRVWRVMEDTDHIYLVLTKRAPRLRRYLLEREHKWSSGVNIWAGVSIETEAQIDRLDSLVGLPVVGRFVSLEPLLGPVAAPLESALSRLDGDDSLWHGCGNPIDWIIAGGESGTGAREMKPEWVRGVKNLCRLRGIPFHFKQWGPRGRGRQLDGRTWDARPPDEARDALWIEPPPELRDTCRTCRKAPVLRHHRCRECLARHRRVATGEAV
jgi:protein gp37